MVRKSMGTVSGGHKNETARIGLLLELISQDLEKIIIDFLELLKNKPHEVRQGFSSPPIFQSGHTCSASFPALKNK